MIRSPAALQWDRGYGCMLRGSNQRISLVIRFYQAEWLCALPVKTGWQKLLQTTEIPVINPTISVISESKRFPLAFNDVTDYPAWKALIPECRDPREVDANDWESWVLKGCYSNTGDKVYICGKLSKEQRKQVIREAQSHPLSWVAQRRFETVPLEFRGGPTHPCIGVFVVNGRAAGAYVRLSPRQITDFAAVETPLLIDRTDY
jgi:glutathionylspermidine synthase